MEQAREDVEKCLSLYEKSGKIPTTIMEARCRLNYNNKYNVEF